MKEILLMWTKLGDYGLRFIGLLPSLFNGARSHWYTGNKIQPSGVTRILSSFNLVCWKGFPLYSTSVLDGQTAFQLNQYSQCNSLRFFQPFRYKDLQFKSLCICVRFCIKEACGFGDARKLLAELFYLMKLWYRKKDKVSMCKIRILYFFFVIQE